MVAIKKFSIAASVLSGVAHQALAAPIASHGLAAGAALEARAMDVAERDLDERKVTAGKVFKTAGKIGKGLLGLIFRDEDLEGRDISELSEREIDELVERYASESDLEDRDLEERKVTAGKVFKTAGKIGKGLLGLIFRDEDLQGRDISELDERDIAELMERYAEEAELEARDYDSELDERDVAELMERYVEEAEMEARDYDLELDKRDLEELDERDLEEFDERDLEEFEERDLEEFDERDLEDLDERDLEERKVTAGKVFKTAGKIGKGLLGLIFRDEGLHARDFELDERDLEYIYARYLADEE